MGRQDEIVAGRLKKIKDLRELKINPYPYKYEPDANSKLIKEKYSKIKEEGESKEVRKVAGRVMSIREFGKITFAVIRDSEGDLQITLREGDTPKEEMEFFKKYGDMGDFFGFEGKVIRTKRGELSILAKKLQLLSKSLLPLPDKWHGLEDKEERYRKRYLDLLMSPEIKEVFKKRERIVDSIREFLKNKEFNEIDTPYLQTIYGGAEARPFKTHLNALDIPLFLAISPELYLKRLIVGGFDKVFTIARNFRNEGIDRWHNPEFSMMEIYYAYADYNDMMVLLEEMVEYVAKKVLGTTKVKYGEHTIDFKAPWKRLTMAQAIKKYGEIDVLKMNDRELLEFVNNNRIECKGKSWGWLVAGIFEHYCEKNLIQPTFITDHPKETTPLCKAHREDERLIERFEPFCAGAELANAYSELNDPVKQKELLEEQAAMLKEGNEEANPYDSDFIEALSYGMPPTGGLGVGIDRLVILLTEQASIRDIIAFPFMKPLPLDNKKEEKKIN
jgi:lysyl-tRNA synthetase, class II